MVCHFFPTRGLYIVASRSQSSPHYEIVFSSFFSKDCRVECCFVSPFCSLQLHLQLTLVSYVSLLATFSYFVLSKPFVFPFSNSCVLTCFFHTSLSVFIFPCVARNHLYTVGLRTKIYTDCVKLLMMDLNNNYCSNIVNEKHKFKGRRCCIQINPKTS
jgi:hypothetical protein